MHEEMEGPEVAVICPSSLMTLECPHLVPNPRPREQPRLRIEPKLHPDPRVRKSPNGSMSAIPPGDAQGHLVTLWEGSSVSVPRRHFSQPWGGGPKEGKVQMSVAVGQWEAW